MICTCEMEGVREVEARRLRIARRMNLTNMFDLTSAIVMSLAFDFAADDSQIDVDQWFGVSVETFLVGRVYVECDEPQDGLAAIWEHLADKFPERVTVRLGTAEFRHRAIERVSNVLLAHVTSTLGQLKEHRKAKHQAGDFSPCEDCSVLSSLYGAAHLALDDAWGWRALEPAIEKAMER